MADAPMAPDVQMAPERLAELRHQAATRALFSHRAALELLAEVDRLAAFKAWVHGWLDQHGVPAEIPDGPHSKEGCRVGDRLEWLLANRSEGRP